MLFLHFFIFMVWGGGHGTVAYPLGTLVVADVINHYEELMQN